MCIFTNECDLNIKLSRFRDLRTEILRDNIINVALDIPETGNLNQIINYLKGEY